MATTKTRNSGAPVLDQAFEQVTQLNEQVTKAAVGAGKTYVETYEKVVDRAIELELKAAEATKQEWLKTLIEAQVDAARELTNSYTTAVRTLLK